MAKNPANDNGLANSVPEAIQAWYRYSYEIRKLKTKQEQCSEEIKREFASARSAGYTDEEIEEHIGSVVIPSWYLLFPKE